MNNKHFIIGILLMFLTCPLFATGQAGQDIAFLDLGVGTRPQGMGSAFSAVANDANAPYWNPAGLAFVKHNDFTTMQTKLVTDVDYYYMSYVSPIGQVTNNSQSANDAWGISWIQGTVSDIPLVSSTNVSTNADLNPNGATNYLTNGLILAYGRMLNERLAGGFSVTGFYEEFPNVTNGKGYGLTLTPGLIYLVNQELTVGLVLKDIMNYQKWDTATAESVIPVARLGFAYKPWNGLLATGELTQQLKDGHSAILHGGIEYNWYKVIAIRAGYDNNSLTAGVSFTMQEFTAEYAYVGQNNYELGTGHRVGLGVRF